MSNPKAQSGLVANKDTATQSMVSLTLNLLPKSCRNDTLQGVDHIVVPMVILTEGVHAGSMGPLYYPKDELEKTPQVWNHKPIVVYHPTMNGQGISACDKDVINTRSVGVMMNTRFDDGKLKSEAWIRKDHANRIDDRIMNAIDEGEMMELSTGVFVDTDPTEGKFGDEAYTGIARNYRPDHLALLPDQIGACSLADGAGFLRNAKKNIPQDVVDRALEKAGLSTNQLSHDDIRSALSTALSERFGRTGINENNVWIMDTFQNFVVYFDDGTLFRIGYTSNDTEVVLSEEQPVEVERVSEYRTVNNANTERKVTMEKNIKKLVDTIIGNAKWSDADRKKLGELPEEELVSMAKMKEANPHFAFNLSAPEAPKVETPKVETPKVETPAANKAEGAPTTVEAYIDAAPAGMKDVLTNSLNMHNQEKARLVSEITANENNTFTPAELDARPLNELRKMAQLMGVKPATPAVPTPNYGGQAPVPAGNAEAEEALVMPTMNFGKESK